MTNMFYGCSNFKGNGIENWNVSNVEIFIGMFTYCSNMYDIDFSNWDMSNGKYLYLFSESIGLSSFFLIIYSVIN